MYKTPRVYPPPIWPILCRVGRYTHSLTAWSGLLDRVHNPDIAKAISGTCWWIILCLWCKNMCITGFLLMICRIILRVTLWLQNSMFMRHWRDDTEYSQHIISWWLCHKFRDDNVCVVDSNSWNVVKCRTGVVGRNHHCRLQCSWLCLVFAWCRCGTSPTGFDHKCLLCNF